ncbi:MAG: lactate racemase domain-containing protein [Eubacteriales bacterium]
MIYESKAGLSSAEVSAALKASLDAGFLRSVGALRYEQPPRRVLLLPPDYTRMYSGAGLLTSIYYKLLSAMGAQVDVMPALGTHAPMTNEEIRIFFRGAVPPESVIVHRWRDDVVKIGEVPGSFVSEVSDGLVRDAIDVEVNRRIVSGGYDLIISMGQVVPHEVVGMANYSKNIFVGCGGASMINSSHMLGAFYGMERVMGRDFSPVRKVFDYAETRFLTDVPLLYVLTATTNEGERVDIHGLYIGRSRENFEAAVAQSQRYNLTYLDKPIQKCVVYLDPREFKSTWLGNKAIYRTRMAMADGGELIIIAPGVARFGEDAENDRLIRKYGYVGRENVLRLVRENDDLKQNLSVAAHLIHGSSDGRFNITYCPGALTREETEGAAFGYIPYGEIIKTYDPAILRDGWNTVGGEEIFYVSNPALGLWSVKR